MQKYMPVVHVIRTGSKYEVSTRPKASFLLPEAEFIAVTAYQVRNQIIDLHINGKIGNATYKCHIVNHLFFLVTIFISALFSIIILY